MTSPWPMQRHKWGARLQSRCRRAAGTNQQGLPKAAPKEALNPQVPVYHTPALKSSDANGLGFPQCHRLLLSNGHLNRSVMASTRLCNDAYHISPASVSGCVLWLRRNEGPLGVRMSQDRSGTVQPAETVARMRGQNPGSAHREGRGQRAEVLTQARLSRPPRNHR